MPSCRFRCRRLTLEQADHQCRTTLGRPTLHFFWPLLVCHLPPRTSRRPCTIGGPILKGGMYGPEPYGASLPVLTTRVIRFQSTNALANPQYGHGDQRFKSYHPHPILFSPRSEISRTHTHSSVSWVVRNTGREVQGASAPGADCQCGKEGYP